MPASQSLTRNIDRTLAFTDETLLPGVRHLQFNHSPAGFIFAGDAINPEDGGGTLRGAGKRTQTGGAKVQINHSVSKNSTVRWMAGPFSEFDTTPQDFVRRSEANWKHKSGTRTFSLTDELINVGEDAHTDQVTEETMNVMGTMVEGVAQGFYNGSGIAITGAESLIGAADQVQGLSGLTYDVWNSPGLSPQGTAAGSISFAGGGFAATGIVNWRKAYVNASKGMRTPNLLLTTKDIMNFYEGTLVAQERYNAPAAIGDAGFETLAFKRAPVLADELCTAGLTLFLNLDVIYLVVLMGADFAFQEWINAGKQETRTSELAFKGQLVIEDRRLCNKVEGQTA